MIIEQIMVQTITNCGYENMKNIRIFAGNSTCHASRRSTLWQVFAFYSPMFHKTKGL